MTDDGGRPVDRLRKHLTGASRLDSLSESFSVFVHDALKDELGDVDLRLALWQGSLTTHPLNLDAPMRLVSRADRDRRMSF